MFRELARPPRRPRLKTRIKRRIRSEVRKRPLFRCGSCGKQYSNPFGHVCTGGGLKKQRAAYERRQAATARREREKAARQVRRQREEGARKKRRQREDEQRRERRAREKAKARKPRRPGRPAHDYANCRDHDCERTACEAWRDGYAACADDTATAARAQS